MYEAMSRARVETPTVPLSPSAKDCFDHIMSTNAMSSSSTQRAPIRFFDDQRYSRYIREQLENKGEDGFSGRKIFRPTYIAIGPRFHREDDLMQGEQWKRMAALDFWEYSDQPFSALFKRVEEVAMLARSYYSPAATAAFTHEEFTNMMFVDGCFLLQLIALHNNFVDGGVLPIGDVHNFGSSLNEIGSPTLLADIFIVENQIPWIVLAALMSIRPIQVMLFIDMHIASWFDKRSARPDQHRLVSANDFQPIHLLDLLCKRQTGGTARAFDMYDEIGTYTQLEVVNLTSATEMAEAGIHICRSHSPRFSDIRFWWHWPVFGRLSLPPLILRQSNLAILLNMLAFQLFYPDRFDNRNDVAAYFGMLSVLVCREEDVQQLRQKGILQTTLSDKEVMKLFKKLESHTYWTNAEDTTYFIRANITDFFNRQWLWIAVHRFVYKNIKFLVAIASFLSISLSILKAILSLPAGSSNN